MSRSMSRSRNTSRSTSRTRAGAGGWFGAWRTSVVPWEERRVVARRGGGADCVVSREFCRETHFWRQKGGELRNALSGAALLPLKGATEWGVTRRLVSGKRAR